MKLPARGAPCVRERNRRRLFSRRRRFRTARRRGSTHPCIRQRRQRQRRLCVCVYTCACIFCPFRLRSSCLLNDIPIPAQLRTSTRT